METRAATRAQPSKTKNDDILVGNDGNVYKRQDGEWQKYEDGKWQDVNKPPKAGQRV